MAKERILYLDLAKLVIIYLVILGHVIFMMHDGLKIGGCLYNFIYSFHMPLFMLLSGFFVSKKMMNMPIHSMLIQKGKQLLLPTITCTIICCIYLFFFRDEVNYRDEIIGNSWFLKTLFIYYVLFYLLNCIPLNKTILLLFSTILLIVILGASTLQINLLWPFFCIGCLLKDYNYMERLRNSLWLKVFFVFSFIVSYIVQLYYDIPNYIPRNFHTFASQPFPILLRYVVAFTGSMSIISLCSLIEGYASSRKFYMNIAYYGKYTLGIYVLQTIIVANVFPDTFAWYEGNKLLFCAVITPLLSLFFLIICLLIIHWFSKSKILDMIFFGGQYYSK